MSLGSVQIADIQLVSIFLDSLDNYNYVKGFSLDMILLLNI